MNLQMVAMVLRASLCKFYHKHLKLPKGYQTYQQLSLDHTFDQVAMDSNESTLHHRGVAMEK